VKLVLIDWVDSHAGSGWLTKDQLQKAAQPCLCRSVGWLFIKNKVCTVVVPHLSSLEDLNGIEHGRGELSIPNKAIVKMTVLREF
jgi:hypothetical protein